MESTVTLNTICVPSEHVISRLVDDEMVLVPLVAGIGDLEGDLYTLNLTGQAIWQKMDGRLTLMEIANLLSTEFSIQLSELENDVLDFADELVQRGLLVVTG